MDLAARIVTLRLAETFTISRGSEDEAEVVQIDLTHDGATGHGEAAREQEVARETLRDIAAIAAHDFQELRRSWRAGTIQLNRLWLRPGPVLFSAP